MIPIDSGRKDIDELKVPATEIAKNLGSERVANIVALAAFVSRSGIVDFDLFKETVKTEFARKEKFIPLNMAAVEEGKKAAQR